MHACMCALKKHQSSIPLHNVHVVLQVLRAHAGLEVVVVQGHLLHLFVLYVLVYVTTRAVS